jgi:cellulose synthase/poly-beta-1,6-N-acetylglucosamine synthase-like glycosyltransferase
MAGGLGAYDLGNEIIYIDNANLTPRGLNYSVRRSFLESIGGFDPNLGRVGKNLLSNEELYLTELAIAQGWQVAYLPDAIAAHNVAPERLKPGWFLRRSWWQGISECYREQIANRSGIAQFGRGGERLIRGLYKSLKYYSDPALRFDNFAYAYGQIGYLSAVTQNLLGLASWSKK